ncbi:MAG TPA: hypothetical protein PKJ53_03550 [Spirochaetales bacterium]|nr:hypothetical protein [Spirochaetales bacterium]
MSSNFLSLVRLFLRSTFDFSFPSKREAKRPKTIAKTLGIVFLALFLVLDLGFVFVESSIAQYKILKPLGSQDLMLFNASTSAFIMVFIFSLLTALSFFSGAASEAAFLSMPIAPAELLGAKMMTVYLLESLFGVFVFLIPVITYGVYEASPLLYWIAGVLNALAIPIIPSALAYLLLIPLMKASKLFRNHNTIFYVSSFIGVAFALCLNILMQSGAGMVAVSPGTTQSLGTQGLTNQIMSRIGRLCLPSFLAWKALTVASSLRLPALVGSPVLSNVLVWLGTLGTTLANFGLGVLVVMPITIFLSKPYAECLMSFGEATLVRQKTGPRFKQDAATNVFRQKSTMRALVQREVRLMNREPSYFLNGPFVVLLIPLILIVVYFTQRASFQEAFGALAPLLEGPGGYLLPAALALFLSLSTSIADSALSRDAHALAWIKSLPISARQYFGAKIVHAELFSVASCLVGVAVMRVFLPVTTTDTLIGLVLALVVSFALNMGGLWLDVAFPRLKWNNPIAALKQNPNVVIWLFAGVALLFGLGYLCYVLKLPRYGYALGLAAVFAVADLALWVAFDRWSSIRYENLEA